MGKDYGEMPLEDFTHKLMQNIISLNIGIWILVGIEVGRMLW